MTNHTRTEPRNGLTFNGRRVSLIDLSGAILMTYLLSWGFGSAALEAAGLPYEDAVRWALMILPGVLTMMMLLRAAARLTMRTISIMRSSMTIITTQMRHSGPQEEDK